ncbi:MAG: helix-hairpin-helix domain-containing protein [Chloroflexota bacterium]|nr:helix-hairpin-helix domain-containing protein [Chloroflexota bacterium]
MYQRRDFLVTLFEADDGTWRARGGPADGQETTASLDLAALSDAVGLVGGTPPLLAYLDQMGHVLSPDTASPPPPDPVTAGRAGQKLHDALLGGPLHAPLHDWLKETRVLSRLMMRIELPHLAALPWELIRFAEGGPPENAEDDPIAIIRHGELRPAVSAYPLGLPLRAVQISPVEPHPGALVDVQRMVADVFRSHETGPPHEDMDKIFRVERQFIDGVSQWASWLPATIVAPPPLDRMDILHLTDVIIPLDLSGTVDRATFVRFLAKARTRLLILQPDPLDPRNYQMGLLLAHAMADHGGPPVLVTRFDSNAGAEGFFARFYDQLIHDVPLDAALDKAERGSDQMGRVALIAGPGGEDLLRISNMESRAYRRRDEAQGRLRQAVNWVDQMRESIPDAWADEHPDWLRLMDARAELDTLEEAMNVLKGDWPLDWNSEFFSSIPFARNLNLVDNVLQMVNRMETHIAAAGAVLGAAKAHAQEERHVNTWLTDQEGAKIPEDKPLWPHHRVIRIWPQHHTYYLHVDIGPYAKESSVDNPLPIPPEALAPIYEKGGDWVHVAVYSQDFHVYNHLKGKTRGCQERPGSAMQRLWLPANVVSQPVFFWVAPKRPGFGYLRICVYYQNQLLQSLRTEARAQGRRGESVGQLPGINAELQTTLEAHGVKTLDDLANRRVKDLVQLTGASWGVANAWIQIATALVAADDDPLLDVPGLDNERAQRLREVGISTLEDLAQAELQRVSKAAGVSREAARDWIVVARRLPDLGYETHIEYTVSASFQKVRELPKRAVSIFSNHTNGTHAIGVKLGEWDEAWGQEDDWTDCMAIEEAGLIDRLNAIRGNLEAIGGRGVYVFATKDHPHHDPPWLANEGTPEKLKNALKGLAKKGYQLYSEIFSREARKELDKVLKEAGQTIHVARVMAGEVLPWATLYSLHLDITREPEDVCLDILGHVDSEGRLDYAACRGQSGCPLNDAGCGRVVCPWGFWGIKHVLEQPPQRISRKAKPRDLITEIRISDAARLSMNVSTRLFLLKTHHERIAQLPGIAQPLPLAGDDRPQAGQPPAIPGKDQVLEALKSHDLHVIYFYCHGGVTAEYTDWDVPYLSVGNAEDQRIVPSDLSQPDRRGRQVYCWPEHPLVFVNGCETVGLRPTVMSEFVRTFAELGAAGVIGTEIKVWEPLATFFAEGFLSRFLAGHQTVGQILRDLRHELLRRYNPLGLIYTNYCSADLRLVRANR